MSGIWSALASAALLGATQTGGAPPTDAAAEKSRLEITFLPGVWLPRLVGTSALGGADIELSLQFGLDDRETTPNLELYVRQDDLWDLILSGFHFSTTASETFIGNATFGSLTLNDGDPIESSFEMSSVAFEFGVTAWRPYADGHSRDQGGDNRTWDGHYIADLKFSPQFGLRWIGVDQEVRTASGEEKTGGDWAALSAGLDITLDYRPQERIPGLAMLRLQGAAALGPAFGDEIGIMFQVRAGVTIQFIEPVGVMVGYRLLEMNVESGGYKLDGGLQGLFFAVSLRF